MQRLLMSASILNVSSTSCSLVELCFGYIMYECLSTSLTLFIDWIQHLAPISDSPSFASKSFAPATFVAIFPRAPRPAPRSIGTA
ncbi:hypothetical protein K437DRAFT_40243 [Tilletiaria anomala UBC 951]|uniref:Uncharacterized protein n=1 Tax=Tilletiaria anomala (strain ATCC 24038 / CBS 436.72 / UBC 951) TaxID=1037660 RepID=A0A066WEA0_TILAU|nr:uncharacterized protein K437DRAFT_40243 [Tilletiaria anomala UBC 951]KDN52106.1 hypothetical protein K437DRAFT_40243 [Tilletiaria anomala UBC 951]